MRRTSLLAALLALYLLSSVQSQLSPYGGYGHYLFHFRLMDYSEKTGNWLYRGPSPLDVRNNMDWNRLHTFFHEEADRNGLTFPDGPNNGTYWVTDLCLLNPDDDDVEHERNSYIDEPYRGEFVWWSTVGLKDDDVVTACHEYGLEPCPENTGQPNNYTSEQVKQLALAWPTWGNTDEIPNRLDTMYDLLHNVHADKPIVQYLHCQCGCDRTGEMSASYYMRYLNIPMSQALSYDESVPHRDISYSNQLAVQWYCEWLYHTHQGAYSDPTVENDCGNCSVGACVDS